MNTFPVATQQNRTGALAPDGLLTLHEKPELRRIVAVVDEGVQPLAGDQVNLFAGIETPLTSIHQRGKFKTGNDLASERAFGHGPTHNVVAVCRLVLNDD